MKDIPEVVIGITEDYELCYMKIKKDIPVIVIAGERNMGMSFVLNNLENYFEWCWKNG